MTGEGAGAPAGGDGAVDGAADSAVDEAVDAVRLAAWAAGAGLVGRDTSLAVSRLSGGSSNLTYRVTGGGRDWVLRRPPARGALPTAHDMAREYRMQAALAGSGVPVAGMVALCADTGVLGAPFYLMERLDGVFHMEAARVAELPVDVAREAGLNLARTLAALHRVDPAAVGLADMIRPEAYLRRQLRRWRGQWDRVGVDDVPQIDALLRGLEAEVPDTEALGIVHGDYNLGNVMYRADRPAEIRAVLDWELSTVGDPAADLGQLLAYWGSAGRLLNAYRGGHLPDANPALPDRAALIEAYSEAYAQAHTRAHGAADAAASGGTADTPVNVPLDAPVGELAYYERFAVVKLAVICAGALARAKSPDPARVRRTIGLIAELAAIAGKVDA